MDNRLKTAQSAVTMRRWNSPAIVALAAMAALTALTADATAKQARPAPPQEATAPRDAGEPIMAIVSIKTQQVTFYDADGWILRAPVSTGITGRETPAGVFAVIEKDKDHHSSMYDDAWMPNMQRITWNGIALHGGPLPGYAASHGCVRMPYGFAEKLFDKTRIGMRVIISPNDAAPVEFSHPALFVPNAGGHRGCSGACRDARPRGRGGRQGGRRGKESRRDSGARDGARSRRRCASWRRSRSRADAELASADKALAAAKTDEAKAQRRGAKQKAAAKAAEAGDAARHRQGRREVETRRRRRRKGCRQGRRDQEGRRRQGGERGEARARAGLDLHQPRDAEALRAAQHAQAVAGRRRGVRFHHRGSGHDPRSREADRHAYVHGDGAQRRPACAGARSRSTTETTPRTRSTASPSRRRCSTASRRPHCRDPRSSSRTSR